MKKSFFLILFISINIMSANCQTQSGILINQSGMQVSFFTQDEACNNGNGNISASVNSGTPPYSYIWSNGDTTGYINNLHAGTYTVIVTDNNGMTASNYATIYNAPLQHGYGIQNNDIFQKCVGIIGLNGISNGVSPYSWNFRDIIVSNSAQAQICATWGQQIATNDGINPTSFHRDVIVTDANGCSGITPIDLKTEGFAKPEIKAFDACHNQANGTIYGLINLRDSSRMYNGFPFLYDFSIYTGGTITGLIYISLYDSINPFPITSTGISPASLLSYYYQFDSLPPGNYHLKFEIDDWPNTIYYNSNPMISTAEDFPIIIHDLGNNCGSVNGNIFVDYNKDCLKNQVDTGINGAIVEIHPGNYFTQTDNQGNYSINLGYGNYTINSSSTIPGLQTKCPSNLPQQVIVDNLHQVQTINFADTSNGIADLFVDISNSNIRPGSQCASYIYLKNNSLSYLTSDTIKLEFDSTLIYNSTNTPSTIITSNSIYWVIDSLAPFQNKNIQVSFDVPLSVNVGDAFKFIATGTTTSLEANALNNIDSTTIIASSSYDPNVKLANPSGYSSNNLIPITQMTFDYQIDFQNTGTDTAFNVVIVDTISEDFNLLSFVQLGSSHPYILEVDSGRIIKFKFNNINLVDSGSNQLLSNGFVKYRITREPNLIEGATIHNSASIYFDNNLPVITNDAFHTLYDCENILQNFIISPILCEGTTSSFTANSTYPATFEWYYNNLFLTTDSSFTTAPLSIGFVPITLIAHTPYCNDTLSYNLNVVAIPTPNIIVNADTLTCDDPNAVSFQWYLNNVLIIGADQINYVASQSGNYTVISTDFIGCTGTSSTIYVSLTGINELKNNEINIQPNPFHNEFTLATSANNGIINSIQIYSVDGRLVYTKDKPSILSGKYKIDLSKLENAVYFLKIKTSTNNFNQVIIKQ